MFSAALLGVILALTPLGIAKAGFFGNLWKMISGQVEDSAKNTSAAAIAIPLLGAQSAQAQPAQLSGVGGPEIDDSAPALSTSQDSALVAMRNPSGIVPASSSDQIILYTVTEGDNPSSIAERFGITLNTLLWSNNLKNPNSIKIGDELIILPVSGVKYEIKKGDTIDSIAKKFRPKDLSEEDFTGFVNDISSYNGFGIDEKLAVGTNIIIPDGEIGPAAAQVQVGKSPARYPSLPEFIGYFLRPILGGRKTQGYHGYNGVDLANSCGLSVMASADGTVILSRGSGWNGGYGKYVVISHSNHTQTLYAHLSQIFVKAGKKIEQGELVGLIGSTGRSTGCHVHFEIRGAKNPF